MGGGIGAGFWILMDCYGIRFGIFLVRWDCGEYYCFGSRIKVGSMLIICKGDYCWDSDVPVQGWGLMLFNCKVDMGFRIG